MKLKFTKIKSPSETIKISFDNGSNYIEKSKYDLLSNGYTFNEDDCTDLENITLFGKNSTKTVKPTFTSELNNSFKSLERWITVSYDNLASYLSTLDSNKVYNIKIPDLKNEHLQDQAGDYSSPLSKVLKTTQAKIKLSLSNEITSIGTCAFNGYTNLKSIVIPEGVTFIGDYAFKNCTNLTSIKIPDSITFISDYAFWGCSNLQFIDDYYLPTISGKTFLYKKVPTDVTSFTIRDDCIGICNKAFHQCSNLTSIEIPKGVTSIGNQAFYDCTQLTDIVIPDGVTSIREYAFYGCTSLTSVTLPDSVTFIDDYAFRHCKSLTSITIPGSVTSIGNTAFYNCTSLTSITISEGVTSIGNYAFQYCSKLATINYTGTEEQWNAISKGSAWNNGVPSKCVINYNYENYVEVKLEDLDE